MRKLNALGYSFAVVLGTSFLTFACVSAASAETVDIGAVDASGAKMMGDPAQGEKVFKQCQQCHRLEEGKNFTGPSLHGIIGRHSGEIPGFMYSKANKESGKVWTPQTLFDYLENPRKAIPGTKMAFIGLRRPQDRADVIAFLIENAGGPGVQAAQSAGEAPAADMPAEGSTAKPE